MNIDEESETRCQSTRSNSFRESFEATFYDQKATKTISRFMALIKVSPINARVFEL